MMNTRIYRSINKSEIGQGITEFALVFPILLLLTLGIIEFGRMLFIYSATASASREAVRYGSAAGDTPGGTPRYMDCTGMQDAAIRVGSIAGIQNADITIQYDHGPLTTAFDTCPVADAEDISGGIDRIVVQVSVDYTPLVPFVNIPGFMINSQSARTVVKDIQVGVEENDDEIDPTVAFTLSGQTVSEDAGTATVVAQLSTTTSNDVTVPFTVSGSATPGAGNDYTIVSSPVTISAGDTTANIVITINDDAFTESDETVVITMGSPTNATKVSPDGHTLTITDNDGALPTVSLGSASQSGAENVGSMSIPVQLSEISGDDVLVPFSVSGSASEGGGNDFTISASPLTIAAGDTSTNITITVNDDGLVEGDETVIVTMGTPTNATKGAPDEHTSTITDNDALPTVSFSLSSQNNSEATATVLARLELDHTTGSDVSVPFSVGGTATQGGGADYTISASPVVISAGSDWANITISVNNDEYDEPDETVVITLGTPTNASLGSPNVHMATIEDDDLPASTPEMTVSLTDSSTKQNKNFWHPTVTVTVKDESNNLLSGVLVAGNFDNGLGSGNCTTVDGECNIKKSMVSSSINPVNFSVTGVILAGYSYSGSDSILLTKP